MCGKSAYDWNIMFTGRSCGGTPVISTSSMRIRPLVCSAKPASMRRSVVLPHPEAPTSANISPLKTLRLTLSTARNAPYILLTPSMTIWGRASGLSQGRSAFALAEVVIMALVVRGRCGAAPFRREERPFDDPRCAHATFPSELPVQVDLGPNVVGRGEVWSIQHRERDVALTGR